MKIQYIVTVELDQDWYGVIKNDGYTDFQIRQNIITNVRGMLSAIRKHWDKAIQDITVTCIDDYDTPINEQRTTTILLDGKEIPVTY